MKYFTGKAFLNNRTILTILPASISILGEPFFVFYVPIQWMLAVACCAHITSFY
jgi:hypothetical protein